MSAAEGWTYLYNSPKWHFFRGCRSLCGRWMYLGPDDALEGDKESKDNCKACIKKREKELTRTAK